MVVARTVLESLSWSNKRTFKSNDYATQLINHFKILERCRQVKTDEAKVMKFLNSMSTSNVAIST